MLQNENESRCAALGDCRGDQRSGTRSSTGAAAAFGPTSGGAAELTDEQAKKVKISTPTPGYPLEARKKHLTGRGIYRLHVAERTGEVFSVEILTSAGDPILDRSAIKTLKTWKFHSHTASAVQVPVTFSMDSSGSKKEHAEKTENEGRKRVR